MSRMIAHIFVDDNGELTVTPIVRASQEDVQRISAIWRHKVLTVDERLSAARK